MLSSVLTPFPATPQTAPPFMIIVNTPGARRPPGVVSAATGRTNGHGGRAQEGHRVVGRGTCRERHNVDPTTISDALT